MNFLALFRHARADNPVAQQPDLERTLSELGQAEAAAQGQWLGVTGFEFNRILCSPSVRTRETAAAAGLEVTHTVNMIYEATAGQLLRLLESHGDAENVCLIGHNPGISALASYLSGQRMTMRPGTIIGLQFPPGTVGPQPGTGRVRLFRHADMDIAE